MGHIIGLVYSIAQVGNVADWMERTRCISSSTVGVEINEISCFLHQWRGVRGPSFGIRVAKQPTGLPKISSPTRGVPLSPTKCHSKTPQACARGLLGGISDSYTEPILGQLCQGNAGESRDSLVVRVDTEGITTTQNRDKDNQMFWHPTQVFQHLGLIFNTKQGLNDSPSRPNSTPWAGSKGHNMPCNTSATNGASQGSSPLLWASAEPIAHNNSNWVLPLCPSLRPKGKIIVEVYPKILTSEPTRPPALGPFGSQLNRDSDLEFPHDGGDTHRLVQLRVGNDSTDSNKTIGDGLGLLDDHHPRRAHKRKGVDSSRAGDLDICIKDTRSTDESLHGFASGQGDSHKGIDFFVATNGQSVPSVLSARILQDHAAAHLAPNTREHHGGLPFALRRLGGLEHQSSGPSPPSAPVGTIHNRSVCFNREPDGSQVQQPLVVPVHSGNRCVHASGVGDGEQLVQ